MKSGDELKAITKTISTELIVQPNVEQQSNRSSSGMGFLDEIKKLAERRACENSLITDTLNKTRPMSAMDKNCMMTRPSALNATANKIGKQLHPDDEKRKQHGMKLISSIIIDYNQ